MQPLVSVIVPVYNVEKYLPRCVDSIRKQTYYNVELLLIDDGSCDSSSKICDEYEQIDERIRTIHIPNGGVSRARNIGLNEAKGDYVTFVDSDDWIEEYTIKNSVEAMLQNDLVVWGYSVDYVDINENCKSSTLISKKMRLCTDFSSLIEEDTSGMVGYVWNKLYKTNIIRAEQLSFDEDVSLYEDMIFNLNYLMVAKNIVFIDNIGTHYIQREGSLGSKYYSNILELKVKTLNKKIEFLNHYTVDAKYIEKWKKKQYIGMIRSSISSIANLKCTEMKKKDLLKFFLSCKNTKNIVKNSRVASVKDIIVIMAIRLNMKGILLKIYGRKNDKSI